MKIFAVGDLHLSKSGEKPMDIFGAAWHNHAERICENWKERVTDDDIVLVPGDLSWAMRLEEAYFDLHDIMCLPGKKVFVRGNHDYWWSSISKVRNAFSEFPNTYFLQNDSVLIDGIAFAGTRGWLCPQSSEYKKQKDEPIYSREILRLEMSLNTLPLGCPRILLMHFPPMADKNCPTGFTDLIEKHGVNNVVYGHLHGASAALGFNGDLRNVRYTLCSADHIGFSPVEVNLSDTRGVDDAYNEE